MFIIIWILLAYLTIVSTLNAIIDYDMKVISEEMVRLAFLDAMINMLTFGVYSIVYFKKRSKIKEGFSLLIILLKNMNNNPSDKLAEKYISYRNCMYQPKSPVYETILNEIRHKLINSDEVSELIKQNLTF